MNKSNKNVYKNIPYGKWLLVHCPTCWYEWEPANKLWWNNLLNILLLIFGVLPWIFYFLWRIMNSVCLCPDCKHEDLWEINWDNKLIKKLQKIVLVQNICYILLILFFFLFVGYEIIFYL